MEIKKKKKTHTLFFPLNYVIYAGLFFMLDLYQIYFHNSMLWGRIALSSLSSRICYVLAKGKAVINFTT